MKYLMAVFIHHFVRNPPVYKRDNIRNVNLKPTRFRGISFLFFHASQLLWCSATMYTHWFDDIAIWENEKWIWSTSIITRREHWCIKHEDIFRNFIIGLQEIRLLLLRKAWQPIAKSIFKPTVLIQIHFL